MLIPQGMAYAMIAGLPPVFGLYAALIPQVIYVIMGTSKQLAVGPVAMDSLLVASGLGALSLSGIEEYVTMAIFLSLFVGIIQFILGFLKFGFVVNFLSKPVISGFTSGAALIIGMSQLKHLFGIEIASNNNPYQLLFNVFQHLKELNFWTLGIGVFSILMILWIKKINQKQHLKIPVALIVVVLGIGIMYLFDLQSFGVKILGNIPIGLPSFELPVINTSKLSELTPIAMTLALVGFMEAISISKAIEDKSEDYEIDANQELIALGTTNIMGSFFQAYPTTGGLSRTAVNHQSGAKTGISALVSTLVVACSLMFLMPIFYYLPNAVLGSIIIVAVFGLIDIKYPVQLFKRTKDEFLLLVITFFITIIIGIKEGIILGVLLSLLLMVYRTSVPHIAVISRISGTNYYKNVLRFKSYVEERKDILAIRIDSQLFFGNKDYFKRELQKQIKRKGEALKLLIINTEAVNYIDSSGAYMLLKMIQELKEKNIQVMFSGTIGPTRDILYKTGIIDVLGKENLFMRSHEAEDYYDGNYQKTAMFKRIAEQTENDMV